MTWPLDPHQPFVFLVAEEDLEGYDDGFCLPPGAYKELTRRWAEDLDREILGVPIGPMPGYKDAPFETIVLKPRGIESAIRLDLGSLLGIPSEIIEAGVKDATYNTMRAGL